MPGSAKYEYQCKVVRFLDGDTLDVLIDLVFHVSLRQRVRVYTLDCRETRTTNVEEKTLGLGDKAHAENLLPVDTVVNIRSYKDGFQNEKYGRWLASITMPDGRDFSATMIASGHGKQYFGGQR